MKWIPTELHSHTIHSDGAMTPATLANQAARAGFGAVSLTDHNTDSGRLEFDRQATSRELVAIPGIELTTFFGHVLVWGNQAAPDWRVCGPSDLGPALAKLERRNQIAVGAAHPFRPGNPLCTGCFWEYDLPWNELDCLEVWSGVDPDLSADNSRALNLWNQVLDQGIQLTATAGRDWHRADTVGGLRSTTFLEVPDNPQPQDFVGALLSGRSVLSLGPRPNLLWGLNGVGSRVDPKDHVSGATLSVEVSDSGWGIALGDVEDAELFVVSNLGVLVTFHLEKTAGAFLVGLDERAVLLAWIRVEVHGFVGGRRRLLAMTNPVYGSLGKFRPKR